MELAWVTRGPQSSEASAREGFQGWVSCHYTYDIGKAVVIKKSYFPPVTPATAEHSNLHPPASLCCGQPLVPTNKEKKCYLDNPEVGELRNAAFLFSLGTVAHSDNTGQKRGKSEGDCWQELAKKILPDQASGL